MNMQCAMGWGADHCEQQMAEARAGQKQPQTCWHPHLQLLHLFPHSLHIPLTHTSQVQATVLCTTALRRRHKWFQ